MPWRSVGSRWRSLVQATLILTACSLFTGRASSAETSFTLRWRSEAKPRCVTEAALQAGVARKLGDALFTDGHRADIMIEGEESALGDDRWKARITERDRGGLVIGEREITAKSCGSLLRAATFVVALFIDPTQDQVPNVEDEAPVSAPREPPTAVAPRTSHAPLPNAVRARSGTPSAFELKLGIGASAAKGLLPSLSGAVLAIARLERRRSRWSFDWTGAYSWPQVVIDGTIRGEFASVEQRLRACHAFVDGATIRVDACGGVLWGAVIPGAAGVLERSGAWRAIVGPTSAVALQLRKGSPGVRLEVGLTVPLRRYVFSYLSNNGDVKSFYSTSGVAVFVALSGLQTIF